MKLYHLHPTKTNKKCYSENITADKQALLPEMSLICYWLLNTFQFHVTLYSFTNVY